MLNRLAAAFSERRARLLRVRLFALRRLETLRAVRHLILRFGGIGRPISRSSNGDLVVQRVHRQVGRACSGDWRWGVFGNLAFTVMLIASSASNVGFAMFDTSSNWLMTSLNPDPMMVSAVQVATTLPMFLLTLPAGALTDIIDARRMLIGAQIAVTAISIVFAAVVTMHWATPAVLLATAFCLGGSGALAAPAWLVITPMLVPKHDLDSAIAINNASYNVSRAIGPAIAGLGIATFSIALAVLVFLRRQYRRPGRADLVARSAPDKRDPSRGAPFQRAAHRVALRQKQSRHRRDAHPRRRLFPVRQRLLGASASGRAHADAQWTGSLRHPARHDRRGFDSWIVRAQQPQGAPRSRPTGDAWDAWAQFSLSGCTALRASRSSRRSRA